MGKTSHLRHCSGCFVDWPLDIPAHYADAIRYNVRRPPQGSLSLLWCSGQQKLATALEFFQYRFSDSFGGNPPL